MLSYTILKLLRFAVQFNTSRFSPIFLYKWNSAKSKKKWTKSFRILLLYLKIGNEQVKGRKLKPKTKTLLILLKHSLQVLIKENGHARQGSAVKEHKVCYFIYSIFYSTKELNFTTTSYTDWINFAKVLHYTFLHLKKIFQINFVIRVTFVLFLKHYYLGKKFLMQVMLNQYTLTQICFKAFTI